MGAVLAKDADHPATGAAAKELLCSSAEITTGDENAQAIVHVLTCGSVDDGKSTLIGRLLWDVADLPEDTRASVAETLLPDGRIDLSRLVDGLAAERAQGITIDIAWRYVDAGARRYVIIDSPGHEQYTRNMATGASHADVAIMLVDARHGVKPQTRRHAAILGLLGVRRVILAVNKMDLVGGNEARFREIEADFRSLTARFAFEEAAAIPVVATTGDNVARSSSTMTWYEGPTLIEQLNRTPPRGSVEAASFRMPVQLVVRRPPDFRGLAGTVTSGSIAVGQTVIDTTSGRRAAVRRIATMDGDLEAAHCGQAVVLQLDADLDIARGAILATPDDPAIRTKRLDARLVWMSETPFDLQRRLFLRSATDLVPVSSVRVSARLDLETLTEIEASDCVHNDVVLAAITLRRPVALDRFADHKGTGALVLVDALTGATVAGGTAVALHEAAGQEEVGFRLTTAMLAEGVCAGVEPTSAEFRRRAIALLKVLKAAGVDAALEANDEEMNGAYLQPSAHPG
ncbi:GTP-binding protein [Hyphomicrobium sp. CS1BSMeth3]|uniref:sulfate adenylyltransferase subunit 1 n=1 Tax=Hyphomicrobium sp. CS1BSMeth3 TaxID=1892844 RepID=UPI000930D505|nr:GTP-binding protein [Hyphomicrobium sp. CS1BSMeth3]